MTLNQEKVQFLSQLEKEIGQAKTQSTSFGLIHVVLYLWERQQHT